MEKTVIHAVCAIGPVIKGGRHGSRPGVRISCKYRIGRKFRRVEKARGRYPRKPQPLSTPWEMLAKQAWVS